MKVNAEKKIAETRDTLTMSEIVRLSHSQKPIDEHGQPHEDLDLIGQTLGLYRVESKLGRGGMAVVFKAHDVSLDRPVALKILKPKISADVDFENRFIREARAIAKIDHPNVVQVYSAAKKHGQLYMAMQYIDGETLEERIESRKRIPVSEALDIARQVACGLAAVHNRGMVHRDIKTTNIMITRGGQVHPVRESQRSSKVSGGRNEGESLSSREGSPEKIPSNGVKIMDFGLSLTLDNKVTVPGLYLGTPMYSSPEQCRTEDVDGRSDLYSLGVVFYEMLTGRVPHVDRSTNVLFRKIEEEPPLPVRHLNPAVPRPVAHLLDRMLAKKPERRFQTADEVIREIDKIQGAMSGPAATPIRTRTHAWRKNWFRTAIAVAVFCVFSLALVAVTNMKPAGKGPAPVEPPREERVEKRLPEPDRNMKSFHLSGTIHDWIEEKV